MKPMEKDRPESMDGILFPLFPSPLVLAHSHVSLQPLSDFVSSHPHSHVPVWPFYSLMLGEEDAWVPAFPPWSTGSHRI